MTRFFGELFLIFVASTAVAHVIFEAGWPASFFSGLLVTAIAFLIFVFAATMVE